MLNTHVHRAAIMSHRVGGPGQANAVVILVFINLVTLIVLSAKDITLLGHAKTWGPIYKISYNLS